MIEYSIDVRQATCTWREKWMCVRLTKEKKLGNEKCASHREIHLHYTIDVLLVRRFVCFIHTRLHTYIGTQCTRQHQAQIDEKNIETTLPHSLSPLFFFCHTLSAFLHSSFVLFLRLEVSTSLMTTSITYTILDDHYYHQ